MVKVSVVNQYIVCFRFIVREIDFGSRSLQPRIVEDGEPFDLESKGSRTWIQRREDRTDQQIQLPANASHVCLTEKFNSRWFHDDIVGQKRKKSCSTMLTSGIRGFGSPTCCIECPNVPPTHPCSAIAAQSTSALSRRGKTTPTCPFVAQSDRTPDNVLETDCHNVLRQIALLYKDYTWSQLLSEVAPASCSRSARMLQSSMSYGQTEQERRAPL